MTDHMKKNIKIMSSLEKAAKHLDDTVRYTLKQCIELLEKGSKNTIDEIITQVLFYSSLLYRENLLKAQIESLNLQILTSDAHKIDTGKEVKQLASLEEEYSQTVRFKAGLIDEFKEMLAKVN